MSVIKAGSLVKVTITLDGEGPHERRVWGRTADVGPGRWVLVKPKPGTGEKNACKQEYIGRYA